MKTSDKVLQAKIDIMKNDLKAIAEKARHLTSPLSAIKITVQGILEDRDCDDIKNRLMDINAATDNSIYIIREIVELTKQYYDS